MVEGEPGAGKSVSLRHLAGTLAARAVSDPESYPVLPLYVNLNELAAANPAQVQPEEIDSYIRGRISAIGSDAKRFLDAHFAWGLREGRWLVLLDSFDEIPAVLSSAQPDIIVRSHARAIHDFARSGMHRSRVVVASRPYRGPGHMPWSRFRILPLGEERRKRIVSSWFNADEAVRVLADLIDTPGLGEWIDNPLLLSLICAHRDAAGALPETAREAFESLVRRRIQGRGDVLARHQMSAEALRAGSERIAYYMTEDTATGLLPSRESLRRILSERAQQAEPVTDAVLDCLIEMKLGRGSATVAQRDGFGFFHRRLQEFFATCHVLNAGHSPTESSLTPAALLTDERWRETVVTLLQVGAPEQLGPILEEARCLFERHAAVAAGAEPCDPSLADSAALDRVRARCSPSEFPWPDGALHLLGIVGSIRRGAAAEHSTLSQTLSALRQQADRLLVAAVTRGLRLDQAWAIESIGAASPAARSTLLSWAFESHSNWLEDIAFQQAAHLEVLPPAVEAGIRRALFSRHLSGELRTEPTRIATQLRRVDREGKFVDTLRLLRIVGPLDYVLLGLVYVSASVILAFAAARLDELVMGGLAAVAIAILSYWLCSWCASSFRGMRQRQALFFAQAAAREAAGKVAKRAAWRAGMKDTAPWFVMTFLSFVRMLPLALGLGETHAFLGTRVELTGVVMLGACYAVAVRPGAYVAVSMGYATKPVLWPLLGLSPVWTLVQAARRRWRLALVLAAILAVYVVVAFWVFRAVVLIFLSYAEILPVLEIAFWGLLRLVYGGGGLLLLGLLIADWRHGRKLRARAEAVEVHQLLRDATGFRFSGRRGAFLRWVREQGKLQPTIGGERLLRDTLLAIERDHARERELPARSIIKQLAGDIPWTKQFRDWYGEQAHARRGLAGWHGETLDELSRLREQLTHHVRDGASP